MPRKTCVNDAGASIKARNRTSVAMMNTPRREHVFLRCNNKEIMKFFKKNPASVRKMRAIKAGRARRRPDRHNGGGASAVMRSSPPHVAFEPIVVSRVTSGPCAGD